MSDATFLILFLAITAIMAIFPFLMKRFGIPAVISLLVVGMLIGPTGVGIDLIRVEIGRANPQTLFGEPRGAIGRNRLLHVPVPLVGTHSLC